MMPAIGPIVVDRRQQADRERADAHERHGDEERVLAADEVADAAEDERAERPDHEADGERARATRSCRRSGCPCGRTCSR